MLVVVGSDAVQDRKEIRQFTSAETTLVLWYLSTVSTLVLLFNFVSVEADKIGN